MVEHWRVLGAYLGVILWALGFARFITSDLAGRLLEATPVKSEVHATTGGGKPIMAHASKKSPVIAEGFGGFLRPRSMSRMIGFAILVVLAAVGAWQIAGALL
jgi:hypothetical protein